MNARWSEWYLRFGPMVTAVLLLGGVVLAGVHGDWLRSLFFLTLAVFVLQYDRTVDAAFRRGWTGGSGEMLSQATKTGLLTDSQGMYLFARAMDARPTRRTYDSEAKSLVIAISALPEDASTEELLAVYEKHLRRHQ